jgi:uncharacterized protein YkwD
VTEGVAANAEADGMRRGLAGFVAACSLAVALTGTTASPPAQATAEERARMLAWINDVRAEHGRKPLDANWKLWRLSRDHSVKMARNGDLYHSRNLSGKLASTNWNTYGENVGVGVEARDLYEAFMRSSGHRANILSRDFDRVGIGFARDGRGILWVTMIFYG